jgi:competence protein ComFC
LNTDSIYHALALAATGKKDWTPDLWLVKSALRRLMNAFLHSAGQWVGTALGFIYPEQCQLCDKQRATPAEGFVCADCRRGVRYITAPFCERCGLPQDGSITNQFACTNCREVELHFATARSAVVARDVVLEVIHRYKYNRAMWFEPFLGDLLVSQAAPELARGQWDLIVPIPLHATKQRQREFNQAEKMAQHLGRAARLPVDSSLVKRVLPTITQTQLSREERLENVRGAFAMRPGRRLRGERVVLVDDVFTTGATASACAHTLLQAGAGEVCVWTVARGV